MCPRAKTPQVLPMDRERASGINKVVPRGKLCIPACWSNGVFTGQQSHESCTGLEESGLQGEPQGLGLRE